MSDSDSENFVIQCAPVVDINSANALYENLKLVIEENSGVDIDAGDVDRVDGAILQIFVGFYREAKTLGLPVTWTKVSQAFYQACDLLGLCEVLELPAMES